MPIYEYECAKCGRRTEALQRVNDPPLAVCPHCGGKLRKLLSAPAFQFRGSGFYATDYAGKKAGRARSDDTKAASDGADGAKPAAKSEGPAEAPPKAPSGSKD